MPFYEYRCTECDHVSEKLRRMSKRKDPLPCEECGAETKNIFSLVKVDLWRKSQGMEIYTNEADATDQLYEQIEQSQSIHD